LFLLLAGLSILVIIFVVVAVAWTLFDMHYPGLAFVFVYFFYDFSILALSACKLGQWEVTLQSTLVRCRCCWGPYLYSTTSCVINLYVCCPDWELFTSDIFPFDFRLLYLFIYLLPAINARVFPARREKFNLTERNFSKIFKMHDLYKQGFFRDGYLSKKRSLRSGL